MVKLKKDKKSPTIILTRTDMEGFHRQMNLYPEELDELVSVWNEMKNSGCYTNL